MQQNLWARLHLLSLLLSWSGVVLRTWALVEHHHSKKETVESEQSLVGTVQLLVGANETADPTDYTICGMSNCSDQVWAHS